MSRSQQIARESAAEVGVTHTAKLWRRLILGHFFTRAILMFIPMALVMKFFRDWLKGWSEDSLALEMLYLLVALLALAGFLRFHEVSFRRYCRAVLRRMKKRDRLEASAADEGV